VILRIMIAVGVLGLVGGLTLAWRRREGRFSEADGVFARADLGLGVREKPSAVVVEFSGADCAPCRTVEARLGEIAARVPELKVVSIDAGDRVDLAGRYEVRRVPTVFVADENLRIIWRASGVPSEDAIMTALLGPDWAGRPHPLKRHAAERPRPSKAHPVERR
jgi:thiol-disulfide isomerase/thioredoxin